MLVIRLFVVCKGKHQFGFLQVFLTDFVVSEKIALFKNNPYYVK